MLTDTLEIVAALLVGLCGAGLLTAALILWAMADAYRRDDEDARAWLVEQEDGDE